MGEATKIEMVDPWGQVVRECAAKGVSRRSVAMTYAFGLRQEPFDGSTASPAIRDANKAIVARWSPAALAWIKQRAWDYVEGRREFGS